MPNKGAYIRYIKFRRCTTLSFDQGDLFHGVRCVQSTLDFAAGVSQGVMLLKNIAIWDKGIMVLRLLRGYCMRVFE